MGYEDYLNEVPGDLIERSGQLNEIHRHPILVPRHLHGIRRSFDAGTRGMSAIADRSKSTLVGNSEVNPRFA